MPLNLRHKNWERSCREFEFLDAQNQPTGESRKVFGGGQKCVDLGGGSFAPYVWDASSQSIRYGDHVCTFDVDGFQTIAEYGSPETLIDDQRFEVQYFKEQGSKWRILDLYNISLSVDQQDDYCKITRRLDDEGGSNWLEVDFLFRPSHNVKLTFRLHVANADQYRIRFQNSGIAGSLIERDFIDFKTKENRGVYKLLFDNLSFSWGESEIAIHDGCTVEDQAGGKKLDFFLGEFDLPAGGEVTISPTVFGAQETSDDCMDYPPGTHVDDFSGILYVGDSNGDGAHIGWIWANVTVPKDATINSAKITVIPKDANGGGCTAYLQGIDENPPVAWGAGELPSTKDRFPTTVTWNESDESGSPLDSPSIVGIIEDITEDAGWESGDNLAICWFDNGSGQNEYQGVAAESADGGEGADLTIDYTSEVNASPSVSKQDLTLSVKAASIDITENASVPVSVQALNLSLNPVALSADNFLLVAKQDLSLGIIPPSVSAGSAIAANKQDLALTVNPATVTVGTFAAVGKLDLSLGINAVALQLSSSAIVNKQDLALSIKPATASGADIVSVPVNKLDLSLSIKPVSVQLSSSIAVNKQDLSLSVKPVSISIDKTVTAAAQNLSLSLLGVSVSVAGSANISVSKLDLSLAVKAATVSYGSAVAVSKLDLNLNILSSTAQIASAAGMLIAVATSRRATMEAETKIPSVECRAKFPRIFAS